MANGFFTAVLRQLGAPVTPENIRALNAWARAEGTAARFNPFATTQDMPGASVFNSIGVKNYPDLQTGIRATAQTLLNGRYGNIISALRAGNNAVDVGRAIADSPWGTGDLVLKVLGAPTVHSGNAPIPPPAEPSLQRNMNSDALFRLLDSIVSTGEVNPLAVVGLGGPSELPLLRPPPQIEPPQGGSSVGVGYPLARQGKIIGLPYQGTHTLYGNWQSDNAVDIAVPIGTPVRAVADGVIGNQIGSLGSNDPHLQGLRVYVDTGHNSFFYQHLSRLTVRPGEHVRAGQIIGYSGAANGVAHLHFAAAHGNPLNLIGAH